MFDSGPDTIFAQKVLDAVAVRSKVALHNLANKSTPGFKRYYVEFEDQLRLALKEDQDFSDVQPLVKRDLSGTPDKNNVIEFDEMASLEKTRALHEIFTRRIGGHFRGLKRAILGR